jgi:hypothetical protein
MSVLLPLQVKVNSGNCPVFSPDTLNQKFLNSKVRILSGIKKTNQSEYCPLYSTTFSDAAGISGASETFTTALPS